MRERAAQVARLRDGVVVQEVDQLTASGAQGGIALDRRLIAARDEDFQPILRIVELSRGRDGRNFLLTRLGRDDDRHQWQCIAHGANLSGVREWAKGKVRYGRSNQ